jgi:hypothetical protein
MLTADITRMYDELLPVRSGTVADYVPQLKRSDGLPGGVGLKDPGVHRLRDGGRTEQVLQLQTGGQQAAFPPFRRLDDPGLLTNLPAQVSSFIGRDSELAEVRGLMGGSRLVTLTGAGGAGKTRLGLQVAAGLADGTGDGVWFADLAPLADPFLVAVTVANVLGVRQEPGRPVLDTVVDVVGGRSLLVVLDNCEHLIGACAKLADALLRGCPNLARVAAVIRVIEDQITTLRPYNARYTGDRRSIFRKAMWRRSPVYHSF